MKVIYGVLVAFVVIAGPVYGQTPVEIVTKVSAGTPADAPPAHVVAVLKRIAYELNAAKVAEGPFGILRKASGHNCVGYSCDIICAGQDDDQQQWDVFLDGNPSRPTWGRVRPPLRTDVCELQINGPGPGPDPGPDPSPEPPPDLAPIYERLTQLDGYVSQLNMWALEMVKENQSLRQRNAEQDAVIANQETRLMETEAAFARLGCRVFLFGCTITR
jgi:hypothetical protein